MLNSLHCDRSIHRGPSQIFQTLIVFLTLTLFCQGCQAAKPVEREVSSKTALGENVFVAPKNRFEQPMSELEEHPAMVDYIKIPEPTNEQYYTLVEFFEKFDLETWDLNNAEEREKYFGIYDDLYDYIDSTEANENNEKNHHDLSSLGNLDQISHVNLHHNGDLLLYVLGVHEGLNFCQSKQNIYILPANHSLYQRVRRNIEEHIGTIDPGGEDILLKKPLEWPFPLVKAANVTKDAEIAKYNWPHVHKKLKITRIYPGYDEWRKENPYGVYGCDYVH